jgi:type I restriction enzyme S subunit
MDMRLGQKLTEAGLIPEDWEVTELHRLCRESITYGIVQCGPHIENGVPYIRVSDMDTRELDVNRMLRTSPAIASKFGRSTVHEGDVVYALRGKLGEVRQITAAVTGANLTQGTARLSPYNETINSEYLLWALRSPQSLTWISQTRAGQGGDPGHQRVF